MTILFAGTSLADFGINGAVVSTTAARLAPYAKEGVDCNFPGRFARMKFTPVSELWVRFHVWGLQMGQTSSGLNTGQFWRAYEVEAGTRLFSIDLDGSTDTAFEMWDGAAFTEFGTASTPMLSSALYKVDIRLKLDNVSGEFQFYVNDVLMITYTGDTIRTAATTISCVELDGGYIGAEANQIFSGVIVSTTDTRNMVFHQGQMTAAGATSDWTGAYTDVTKLTVDDTTFISSGTADQVETYVAENVNAALSAYSVEAVVLATRTRRGTTGPQNLQAVVRQSGVDHVTADLTGIDGAYGAIRAIMTANPATSGAWTIAEIDAAEFGVKSKT